MIASARFSHPAGGFAVTSPQPEKLVIWAVSDGKAGNAAPSLGLAEAVARRRPAEIVVKTVGWKGFSGRLPWWLVPAPRLWLDGASGMSPPWPDLWIATGRATLPLDMAVRRWSGGRTFVVHVQDPRAPASAFDLVVAPRHDGIEGPNVLKITGSPHRVTPDRLAADRARFAATIDPLPHPRTAVLVGGRSKAHDLSPERAAALADQIGAAIEREGGSLLLTFSRRTPEPAKAAFRARLGALPGQMWDGEGDNPYFAFLDAADVILATEDSANMATEAAAVGRPLHILPLDGGSPKFRRFHADLQSRGVARPFNGDLTPWPCEPLNETERAADEIVRRLELRRQR